MRARSLNPMRAEGLETRPKRSPVASANPISPTIASNAATLFEAMVGLMGFALATGLQRESHQSDHRFERCNTVCFDADGSIVSVAHGGQRMGAKEKIVQKSQKGRG